MTVPARSDSMLLARAGACWVGADGSWRVNSSGGKYLRLLRGRTTFVVVHRLSTIESA
jgi:hypothetical protein